MPLSWNEIKDRALAFSREWESETSEDAEAKSFWDGFFSVFGVSRRRMASFETPVKKSDGAGGYIDLLWRGVLLAEHKSRGRDLDKAFDQAREYFPGLKDRDLPQYILVSDFARFRLYDLDSGDIQEFPLQDLHKNVRLFGFMAGYQTRSFGEEDPVNVQAADRLGQLHDLLKASGYVDHPLEALLVRILFCLFADDTSIFERRQFADFIEQRTAEDGSDLGTRLAHLFQILNTPKAQRQTNLDEQLAAFPYVNGKLFEETLPIPSFDRKMRESLLEAAALDWSRISPAIFGSLFQSIMDVKARRDLGAHYTTETNILKALNPLFLDNLRAEFEKVKKDRRKLNDFRRKLASIRVFDPACGCGNFLVVAYREMRQLELEALRAILKNETTRLLSIDDIMWVDVDQFYGVEIEEFPAQIAQTALWLMDHQMNMKVSQEFGLYLVRLPLKKAPKIIHGNALRMDWRDIVDPKDLSYIVGNPPFVGKKEQSERQKEEVLTVFKDIKGAGILDYVTCWYRMAAQYIHENAFIRVSFVSTNSVTQGEQVGVLWSCLHKEGIKIHFAHRTFQWTSEARRAAAVHCVIIGFSLQDIAPKWLFEYETSKSEPLVRQVEKINAYLVEADPVLMMRRSKPLSGNIAEMNYGSMPIDNGWLILSREERDKLLQDEPESAPCIRRYMGGDEFINNIPRYCLWLENIDPVLLRRLKHVHQRIDGNKAYRLSSGRETTRKLASVPGLFGEIRQPETPYLLVPKVSSESRFYLPIGFCKPDVIASGSTLVVPNATFYEFGILSSLMHNVWMRAVCGRMKSDYQYSAGIVYNNFPWPEPTEKQRQKIKDTAQGILAARAQFPKAALADLYDPLAMPPVLVKAHQALDRAVDATYGRTNFVSEAERVAFLFSLYQKLIAPLPLGEKGAKARKTGKPKKAEEVL
ncbi:MAG: N-6 DNA methylase [Pseudomonadota bacterium]|nr:N-6 DNA methylase [Pseudomonadota bacterium]